MRPRRATSSPASRPTGRPGSAARRSTARPVMRISVSGWNTREDDIDRSADAILRAVDAGARRRRRSALIGVDRHRGHRHRARSEVAAVGGAETISSTTSRPFVTCPNSV